MANIADKKKEFIKHCADIAAKGLSWGASGNMSMRVTKDRFLVTASGSQFSRMHQKAIATCKVRDCSVVGTIKPSVEARMHQGILKQRSDVNCIVHVHPLYSVLMISAKKVTLKWNLIPEAEHYLGNVKTVAYHKAGTLTLANEVAGKASDTALILLKNHGIVALGKTFDDALCVAEACEFIAKLNYHAQLAKMTLPEL